MAQGSAGLCATCAAPDRRLCMLDERTSTVLKLLAPDVVCTAPVCWECSAVLARVQRFREVATRVQRALLRHSENQPHPLSMTALIISPTTTDEMLPNDSVKNEPCEPQNIEERIKIEPEINVDFAPIDEHAFSPDSENKPLKSIKKVKIRKPNTRELKKKLLKKYEGEGLATAKKCAGEQGFVIAKKSVKRVRHIPDCYKCKECGKEFKTRGTFEYHKESHRDKPQCEDCGRTFVSKSTLWTHRQLVHVDSEKWSCDLCKKVFFTEAGHAAHAASHRDRDRDRFYCRPCDKFFKSNSSYRKHGRSAARHIDPGASRFGCSACDRKFQTEERAKEHYDIIHLQKNKFTCRQCPRQYCTARALRIHERVKHENITQPRDKVCEQCGKGFRTVQVLKSHIRTHTGERPYSCRLCPSRFTQNGALHTHNKLVHLNMRRNKKTV